MCYSGHVFTFNIPFHLHDLVHNPLPFSLLWLILSLFILLWGIPGVSLILPQPSSSYGVFLVYPFGLVFYTCQSQNVPLRSIVPLCPRVSLVLPSISGPPVVVYKLRPNTGEQHTCSLRFSSKQE